MRWNWSMAASALAILVALAAGCSDPYKVPPAGRADPLPPGAYPRNVAEDGLADGVVFGTPTITPATETSPLHIVQPIRAITDYSLNTQYWFEWFDAQKRPLNTPNWTFQALTPKVEVMLQGNAPDTRATEWRLHVRPAR